MSKFCENCGAEMNDDQVVCPNCGNGAEAKTEAVKTENVKSGETVSTETTSTTSSYTTTTSTAKKNGLITFGIIAGIVAVIAIVVSIIIGIVSGGWKKPIDNYYKGLEKGKLETYQKAFPDFYNDKNKLTDDDMEEIHDNLEDKYGEKFKVT